MARKKKTTDTTDSFDLIQPIQDIQLFDDTEQTYCPTEDELNRTAVIIAAKELVEHYALTHTIHNFDSYKYPKMKELAIALSKL